MRFVIVTGMSGAGKSTALKMLEDFGYFCADNLPLPLVDKLASFGTAASGEYSKVALGIDVRSIHTSEEASGLLDRLDSTGIRYEILYLEADDDSLIRRYKETRRSHPLSRDGRIDEGIRKERVILAEVRRRADYIIDTSQMLTRDLRTEMNKIFVEQVKYSNLFITVLSFGFKYGIPVDADLVFDVRFLPNPYYADELKRKTGLDKDVRDYVYNGGLAANFEKKWFDLIDFLLPNYVNEGKTQLVIAVGCTGGRHRSVAMAASLYEHIRGRMTYGVRLDHRDIYR